MQVRQAGNKQEAIVFPQFSNFSFFWVMIGKPFKNVGMELQTLSNDMNVMCKRIGLGAKHILKKMPPIEASLTGFILGIGVMVLTTLPPGQNLVGLGLISFGIFQTVGVIRWILGADQFDNVLTALTKLEEAAVKREEAAAKREEAAAKREEKFYQWARKNAEETAERERKNAEETAEREENYAKQLEALTKALANLVDRIDKRFGTTVDKSPSDK